MKPNESGGTFVIQPRRLHVWGELWHAMAFTCTGTGGALYIYLIFLGVGEGRANTIVELLAMALVFFGALIIFTLELTYRSVFLRYFFVNIGQSWISRGVVALFLFGVLSVVSLLLDSFSPGTEMLSRVLTIIAGLAALFVIIYPSLLFSSAAVPFWRSGLLPVEFLVSGGIGGLAIVVLLQAVSDVGVFLSHVLITLGFLLAINFLLHLVHLGRIPESTRKETVKLLTQGELRSWFLIGFMVLGVAFPFMLVVVGYFLEGLSGSPLLLAIGILALLGVFAQRYCLLKAGIKPALI